MKDLQSFYSLATGRRSIRKFRDQPVPHECVERIIQAGTWAPSAHNAQPWRFIVLETPKMKRKLAEAMASKYRQDLEADGLLPEELEMVIAASIKRFTHAPVLILVALTMERMDVYSDERRQQVEFIMAVQSTAAAIQNVLLAAHAEGLGTCWCCAPLFCTNQVRAALDLAASFQPQALITLGFPSETPAPPDRRSSSEISQYAD